MSPQAIPSLSSPAELLTVRFLGGAAIERAGRPLAHRAALRHGLGLLALLATARGRLLSRDKILAMLWPEGESETLRHRLNVLLYELRRVLGRDAILTVNGDLRLDTQRVWVDVVQFAAAIEEGDAAEALALYQGPFLDGFYLPESPGFEQWGQGERHRLGGLLKEVLERDAVQAERAGDLRLAVQRWRRLVDLDPVESRCVLRLMDALVGTGEPAEALRMADLHAARRATELEAAPDAAVTAKAASLREPVDANPKDTVVEAAPDSVALRERVGWEIPVAPDRSASGLWLARRRALLPLAALLLIAVTLLIGSRLNTPARGAAPAAGRMVILPFQVRGSDRLAYLSDGMAELLTLTLDGAGPIRTVDLHAVLAFARQQDEGAGSPALGRQVAARFGAAWFVLGSVIESGRQLEIQASLYDEAGRLVVRAAGGAGESGDIMPVVDSLTRTLISAVYRSGADRLARLAATTTGSLSALKAYLEGEALLRTGEHEAAAAAYRRATALDSTFALAWYRLAVASEWSLQPREALAAVERAVRHAARLPQRDSLLLTGWEAYAQGDADRAEAVYRRVLELFPDETEAWLQLGEIRFHHAPSRGVGIDSALSAFDAVLALDPDHEGARLHLARIAAYGGNAGELDRHVDYLMAHGPAPGVELEVRALRAFANGDDAAIQQLLPAFRREDSYTVLSALISLFHAGNLEGVVWCADILRDPARPLDVQTGGTLILTLAELARGREGSAQAGLERIEALDPERGLELRAIVATLPFRPVDSAASTRLRGALGAALMEEASHRAGESFFLPDPDRLRPLFRRYLLGLLHAQLGDSAAALAVATELEQATSPAGDPSLAMDLALGIRAEVDRLGGRTGAALASLQRIRDHARYQLVLPAPFEPRVRERFVRALLLTELGRPREARDLFRVIGYSSVYDLPYLAPARAHLGPT